MTKDEFILRVRQIAEQKLNEQGEEVTEEAIQQQAKWLAALSNARSLLETATLKDTAEILIDGIPPLNFDEWAGTVVEGEEDDEYSFPQTILDELREF